MNKIIYSLRIMEDLVSRGFTPITSMPNPKNPKYQCWIFKQTIEFQNAINEILGGIKNE